MKYLNTYKQRFIHEMFPVVPIDIILLIFTFGSFSHVGSSANRQLRYTLWRPNIGKQLASYKIYAIRKGSSWISTSRHLKVCVIFPLNSNWRIFAYRELMCEKYSRSYNVNHKQIQEEDMLINEYENYCQKIGRDQKIRGDSRLWSEFKMIWVERPIRWQ